MIEETNYQEDNSQTIATINASRRSWLWLYAPLFLWMGFIFFASTGEMSASNTSRIIRPLVLWLYPSTSEESLRFIHFMVRKCAHFTEYAILAFFAARAFIGSSVKLLSQSWFFSSLLLVAIYALTDEIHQSFVSTRTGSIYDSMIDTAGGLTMLVAFALYRNRKSKKQASKD